MTDQYSTLTVVLDKNIREDDAEDLLTAIRMIKGVLDVKGNVSDIAQYAAEARVKTKIANKMIDAIWEVE